MKNLQLPEPKNTLNTTPQNPIPFDKFYDNFKRSILD